MMGLLYKDFIGSKNKFYLTLLLIAFGLLLLLKVISLNSLECELFVYVIYAGIVLASYFLLIFTIDTAIFKVDSSKQIDYYLSTPTSRTGYVLSKYLYFFIAYGVSLCLAYGGLFVAKKGMFGTAMIHDLNTIRGFLPYFNGIALAVCAFEYPFYFAFGVNKGKIIKEGLFIALMFAVMAYMFFGDLDVIFNLDLNKILNNSKAITKTLKWAFPMGGLVLYITSFFLSKLIFTKKKAG